MCGIAGFLIPPGPPEAELTTWAASMADAIAHRGPDASGTWADESAGIALGHRRLSILDLSPLGAQPMSSACGRFVTAYNGEIYNHLKLRRELEAEGHAFRGGSDTETMLAAISAWGLEAAVKRFVGMFAIALWDRKKRSLSLVRDRLGIKPLYYGTAGNALLFGSELKALRTCPAFEAVIDRDALALYFRHNYIPAPHSIYKGINKLLPGHILTFAGPGAPERDRCYWSARQVWAAGVATPFSGSEDEAVVELERLLTDAVGQRMLSDVPLGAFLSGGIDSSTVVALMQQRSDQPVKTFSIGFHEAAYNEAEHARAVAKHLGTDHTELYVTPQDLLDVVPDMPAYWDEPFADSSQIPTFILSRLARQHVTVSLSGDGGDELFAGYERYRWADTWRMIQRIPLPIRKLAAQGHRLPRRWFDLLGWLGPRLHWRLEALALNSFNEFYRFFMSHMKTPERFVLGAQEPPTSLLNDPATDLGDTHRRMTYWDVTNYLPDDILTKVDRASMAVSLEARVPLLDHRVVEFAASVPTGWKVKHGQAKHLLRQVLYRHVPETLVERPKMGFGIPVRHWLEKELRPWCEDLLARDAIRGQGYLDADEVRHMWNLYLGGQWNYCHQLWDVLMFQAWLEKNGETP